VASLVLLEVSRRVPDVRRFVATRKVAMVRLITASHRFATAVHYVWKKSIAYLCIRSCPVTCDHGWYMQVSLILTMLSFGRTSLPST
jgi:hypothetical protein